MTEIENMFFNKLTKRCDKWYPYFDVYEKYLNKFRNKDCKILEIGVQKGGSLELWHEYFGPQCKIYGVDNDPKVADLNYDFTVDLEIGDQENIQFWKDYTEQRGFFDIIIDDGGHKMKQQENTLLSLFGKLNYGGVYIIEDTHTSYWEDFDGGFKKEGSIIEITKMLIDLLHVRHIDKEKPNNEILNVFHGLQSVAFYDSMIILEKERPKDFKRIFSN